MNHISNSRVTIRKSFSLIICIVVLFTVSSCDKSKHFISDRSCRKKVEAQFAIQKELAKNRAEQLFGIFREDLTTEEEEALEFLYAYMPLSDLADYDGAFYLKNVRASLAARDTFSWGKAIPEKLFRHFVLPVRVNNENLDSSRWIFFMELKDRIKNKSMKEAVLEINHWCHEKVTYKSTDGRTSSPLSTVKTAFGRCGEESTFTVAALRSVGIPARQCYTPRWAHVDDNHAWVEVWIDGAWHYIGACEPEPEVDIAWFSTPAKRAMLVSTNVFGDYEGPEDVLLKDQRFTRINVLENYTRTKRIVVRVVNEMNRPVDSADIEYQLYNYAEFYPLHRTLTDKDGLSSFLTGYGDIMVWASKEGLYGYLKVLGILSDTITLKISGKPGKVYSESFDLVPPVEDNIIKKISDSLMDVNTRRIEFENRIRSNYESTFIDSLKSIRLAGTLKLNPDTLWRFLKGSRGNWRGIIDFITDVPQEKRSLIFPLLENISEKDLRDADPAVLLDDIMNSLQFPSLTSSKQLFATYILSSRIDNELLKPFKSHFHSAFQKEQIEKFRKDPIEISKWVKSNITIDNVANYSRAPLTPAGSFDLKVADPHSRDILFVALCRSFGIPSRIEPATKQPQYLKNEKWTDVYFENPPDVENERGKIILTTDPENSKKPEYYIHFTIQKFRDGFFRSLDYEYDPRLTDFPCTLELEPGYYRTVTGNRMPDGTVLSKLSYYMIGQNETSEAEISLREKIASPQVLGMIDLKNFLPGIDRSVPVYNNPPGGLIISWMEPEREPTKHFIADLKSKKQQFDEWNIGILLLFKNDREKTTFMAKNSALPSRVRCFVPNPTALKEVFSAVQKSVSNQFPVVVFLSKKGEILYFSEGYRIGTTDELMRYRKLR